MTVNQDVTGSSPVTGASNPANHHGWRDFCFDLVLILALMVVVGVAHKIWRCYVHTAHSCLVRAIAIEKFYDVNILILSLI